MRSRHPSQRRTRKWRRRTAIDGDVSSTNRRPPGAHAAPRAPPCGWRAPSRTAAGRARRASSPASAYAASRRVTTRVTITSCTGAKQAACATAGTWSRGAHTGAATRTGRSPPHMGVPTRVPTGVQSPRARLRFRRVPPRGTYRRRCSASHSSVCSWRSSPWLARGARTSLPPPARVARRSVRSRRSC